MAEKRKHVSFFKSRQTKFYTKNWENATFNQSLMMIDAEKEISMLYDDLEDKLESLKDRLLVQKSITDYFA